MSYKIEIEDLNAWFGNNHVIKHINMRVRENAVTAVIGPSGCGKTTLIRCINRMHELVPGAGVSGRILLDEEEIYGADFQPRVYHVRRADILHA